MKNVLLGKIYRHYKGVFYLVIEIDESDLQIPLVVCQVISDQKNNETEDLIIKVFERDFFCESIIFDGYLFERFQLVL